MHFYGFVLELKFFPPLRPPPSSHSYLKPALMLVMVTSNLWLHLHMEITSTELHLLSNFEKLIQILRSKTNPITIYSTNISYQHHLKMVQDQILLCSKHVVLLQ